MRKTAVSLAATFMFAGFGAACSDQTPTGTDDFDALGVDADAASTDTTSPPDDTDQPPGDAVADSGNDTGPVDTGPVDTGPVDTGQPDTGIDTGTDTGVDTGTDTGMGNDTDTSTSKFGPGSFIRNLYIDKQNPGTPRCCFDYDGDPDNDNAVADALDDITAISTSDANMNINDDIEAGDLILLLEHKNWGTSNWQNDSSILPIVHPGEDAMPDFMDNLMGNGTFEISPDSFDSNGDPKSKFNSASVSSRDITADQGTIELSLSVGQNVSVDLKIQQADMEATAKQSSDVSSGGTVPLENGKLGGIITKKNFYGAINDNCNSCSAGQRISRTSSGSDTWECNASTGCTCTPSLLESGFACSQVTDAVGNNADIDQDSDGTNDALSFGASFMAVAAEIVGVANP